MDLDLHGLAETIRSGRGLAHKADIAAIVGRLGPGIGAVPNGDDCAAIPDGDGHLLFAIEGFLESFVADDPRFAGWCGVMVNLSDIAAMGGRPIAVVDALWSPGPAGAQAVVAGLAAAAEAYDVPVVGGHTNTRAATANLAVAVLGRAGKTLLTSFDAKPGDALIAAIDLRGAFRDPHPYWDAASNAPPDRLRADLAILPGLAEDGLARAAKDISMAGLVGTALMLMECSDVGGTLDLTALPRPEGVPIARWLAAFPSFGFLVATCPDRQEAVIERFAARGIAAARIGTIDASRVARISDRATEAEVWDFARDPLTGCGPR